MYLDYVYIYMYIYIYTYILAFVGVIHVINQHTYGLIHENRIESAFSLHKPQ